VLATGGPLQAAAGGEQGGSAIIALVQELETRWNGQADVVPAMQQVCNQSCRAGHACT
jgi:hypothetical protein